MPSNAVLVPNITFSPGCYLYFDDDGEVKEAEEVFSAALDF